MTLVQILFMMVPKKNLFMLFISLDRTFRSLTIVCGCRREQRQSKHTDWMMSNLMAWITMLLERHMSGMRFFEKSQDTKERSSLISGLSIPSTDSANSLDLQEELTEIYLLLTRIASIFSCRNIKQEWM